jgi:hypothetical protein
MFAFVAGCGPSGPATYAVSGTITFNGEPIPDDHNGYVTFVPDNKSHGPESGPIKGGRFSFRSREGTQKVQIWASKYVEGQMNAVMGMTPKVMYIPENYNEATTLTADVKPNDDNEYTFELVGKK